MSQEASIQLFENAKIRVVWDDVEEKYYFSVVDVIQVLTESTVAKRYWTDLKRRLKEEGADETYAKILRLKWLLRMERGYYWRKRSVVEESN